MKAVRILQLLGVNLLYSCTSILTRSAADYRFLSWEYVCLLMGVVFIMGTYAIIWQQILKKVAVSDAYMFKGSTIVFTIILANVFFDEPITLTNIIGATLVVLGITLYAFES